MHKKIVLILSCMIALHAQDKELEQHELFWTYNDVWGNLYAWSQSYNDISRKIVRNYIDKKHYRSVLDIPCGPVPEYCGYRAENRSIEYYGVDITQRFVDFGLTLGAGVQQGSIEHIPFQDKAVDVCYARHILEHLSYYTKALNELIRVAKKEVIVIFFIAPGSEQDTIRCTYEKCSILYNNYYNKNAIEKYVRAHERVLITAWETVPQSTPYGDELILHIYLKP